MRNQFRLKCATLAGLTASRLSQSLGRGRGETLFGRVISLIDPGALEKLGFGRDIVLVSGTNGKTTSTRVLVDLIARGTGEYVSTAKYGANMISGITAALAQTPRHRLVVLECDELYLPEMYNRLAPRVVVLLNLSRDQLHRTGEVRKVAQRWHDTFTRDDVTLVIDRDDPFLEYAAAQAGHVIRVTFGGRRHPDAATCPSCSALLNWSAGDYSCSCGLGSVLADVRANKTLRGPARNAVLMVEAARLMGADVPVEALEELTSNTPDRMSVFEFAGQKVQVKLAKNPESWREALLDAQTDQVILSVNARGIDGLDTSWLWDIDYSVLRGKFVVCTGERALDVAYRLSVQGIDVRVADTFSHAVDVIRNQAVNGEGLEIFAIASYTAYQDEAARHEGVRP